MKTYSSREDLVSQRKRNLADAAAPNSLHRIPEAPLPSATQHPPAANALANGGRGLINGALAQKQQAYALIISCIFNIQNALLISDASHQICVFLPLKTREVNCEYC